MFQFELKDAKAVLETYKPDTKKSVDGIAPCAELTLSVSLDASVLEFFAPTLKHSLFNVAAKDPGGGHPLRDPNMLYPLQRGEEMGGAIVDLGYGLKEVVSFPCANLDQFRITPMAGSVVLLKFRVQCAPTEHQAGRLYSLQKMPVTLNVTPSQMALPEVA